MTIQRMGDSPRRREDARFVTGQGAYLDDLKFERLTHAVVLRSPHAHALVRSIDATAARAAPGVLAVLTAAEATADGLNPLRPYAEANVQTGEPFAFAAQPLLATDKVRFAGEPVALIVAETHAQALDAAEQVVVDYQTLPAVTSAGAARAPGAPQLSREIPGNTCLDWRTGDTAGAEAAFAAAAHVVSLDLDNHRIVMNPMEPRGGVGTFDRDRPLHAPRLQPEHPHQPQPRGARARCRAEGRAVRGARRGRRIRRQELRLCRACADPVGRPQGRRPVKWIASRSEVFLSDHAARDMRAEASLALDAQGKLLALRIASVANLGAYMAGAGGGVQTFQYIHLQGSVYRIPAIALHVVAVVTNTAPIGVTRGPGFAEAINIVERLIDAAAHRTGFDRADLRRWNMVPPEAMPMTNAFGFEVDSGHFAESLDQALGRADCAGFEARRRESAQRGRLRGLGFAYHIKATGGPPDENVDVRFEADGTISLITGTQHIGQGHETTFPQILSTRLGVPNARIRLVQGDTDAIPFGGGHGSSRATYMGGTAIWRASDEIIAKGTGLAADALEASEADIRFEEGRFVVSGTDRAIGLLEVAALGRDKGKPLDTFHAWKREHMTFPNGAHVVEVEIDRDTGQVALARYTAVDDYGVLVNPMVATGQAHGAMAQGAGQALLEHATYDPAHRARWWPARSWTMPCRAPTTCRRSISASIRPAARPIRWA